MAHGDTRREQRFAAAALAMQGLLAGQSVSTAGYEGVVKPGEDCNLVSRAVQYADELLAKLDSTEANKDKTS